MENMKSVAKKMPVTLRPVRKQDLRTVAEMNHELIRAEGSVNPMSLPELEARMRGWLKGEYRALLVMHGSEVIGYLLFRPEANEYFQERPRFYIRQYFIRKENRRQGFGRAGLDEFIKRHLPEKAEISVEVLETNPGGKKFWEKVGFRKYLTCLRRS
jgi:ribosomal protein S18 acetylase RimI-like enzyme